MLSIDILKLLKEKKISEAIIKIAEEVESLKDQVNNIEGLGE